jgi:hypothetical protein
MLGSGMIVDVVAVAVVIESRLVVLVHGRVTQVVRSYVIVVLCLVN